MRIPARFILLIAVCCLGTVTLHAAQPEARASFSIRHANPKKIIIDEASGPRHVLTLEFVDASQVPVEHAIAKGQGQPFDPQGYSLDVKSGDSTSTVAISKIKGLGDSGQGMVSTLEFSVDPQHSFSSKNTYTLRVLPNTLFIKDDAGQIAAFNGGTETAFKADSDVLELDQDFIAPQSVENKVEVLGGSAGGVASFHYRKGINKINDRHWMNAAIDLNADFNFQASERKEYFNSVAGEAKMFLPFRWNFPWAPVNEREKRARYSEFDLHLRFESDQTFDNADRVIGSRIGTFTKDPLSKFLGKHLVLNGFAENTEASVSPLLVIGYDYAKNLKTESPATQRLDTHEGNHRAVGSLYWSLPLGRQLDIGFIGIKKRIDVDLLTELHAIYDFRVDKVLDQSKVSLNFSPHTADSTRMVYSLSWERGKKGPTFQDVEALLAGMKVNF